MVVALATAVWAAVILAGGAGTRLRPLSSDENPKQFLKLFDGKSLAGWRETEFSGRGEVQCGSNLLVLTMGDPFTGVNYTNEFPKMNYEVALDAMAERGYRFAVCTNKLEWLSKRLLDQLGLSGRFAAICGADTFGVSKPDPIILQQTVARAGGDMAATIMVGDAGPDVGVARRAGIPVIGVEFGYTDVPIAELKPDRLIGHMRDLPAAVESLSKITS